MFVVPLQDAKTYAEDTGLLFMETSAKTAINVNELFLAIGENDAVFIVIVSKRQVDRRQSGVLVNKELFFF